MAFTYDDLHRESDRMNSEVIPTASTESSSQCQRSFIEQVPCSVSSASLLYSLAMQRVSNALRVIVGIGTTRRVKSSQMSLQCTRSI